ncbi:MAG: InlB B-repeat-containing protein [Christensenellaceae bacterium]|jgi:uncharacterized repeat protein (TIGR02543 family)|nr:InlB B-repeat-containing protein [Christensenellaceae bacterium]
MVKPTMQKKSFLITRIVFVALFISLFVALIALSLDVNLNETNYQIFAEESLSLPDFVVSANNTEISIPEREPLPSKNQYVLKVELKADMTGSVGVATRQYVRFLYSTNSGASFSVILPRSNTQITTQDSYNHGDSDSNGWFVYGMVSSPGEVISSPSHYIENAEVHKILWGILVNEHYNNIDYPIYDSTTSAPTIYFVGTYAVPYKSNFNLVLMAGKSCFLSGSIALLSNYSQNQSSDYETISAFQFDNESYYKKPTSNDSYDENDLDNPINNLNSLLSGYNSVSDNSAALPYSIYSDINIGIGKNYVLSQETISSDYYFKSTGPASAPILGLDNSLIYRNSSLVVINGAADVCFFGGTIGDGSSGAAIEASPKHSTILLSGPDTSITKSTLVIQDSATILDFHLNANITTSNAYTDVILHTGGIIERKTTGAVVETTESNNKIANLYLLGGTLQNAGGTAINWGSSQTSYLILVDSYVSTGATPSVDKVSINTSGVVEFIMTGGIIENKMSDGSVIKNSTPSLINIQGGQLLCKDSSNPTVENSSTGTITIQNNVYIANNKTDGIALKNTSTGQIRLSLDAQIIGGLDFNISGSYVYFADIPNSTENLDCLYDDISHLKIGTSYSFVSTNEDYTLSEANGKLYALIYITYIQYTETDDSNDSVPGIDGYYIKAKALAKTGKYPLESSESNNYNSGDYFKAYPGFSVKYYVFETNIEVFPGDILTGDYKKPHTLRCELVLNSPIIDLTNEQINATYAKNKEHTISISYSHQLDNNVTYLSDWSVDKTKTGLSYTKIDGLAPNQTSLKFSNVIDSGYYRHTLITSIAKYGIEHKTSPIDSYFDVTINKQTVPINNILLRFQNTADSFSTELPSVITKGISLQAEFQITDSNSTSLDESAPALDFVAAYRNNVFANNDGTNGIAELTITFSDNYIVGMGGALYQSIVTKTFEIIARKVVSIAVTYFDFTFATSHYKRTYNAFEEIDIYGIALIATYNDGSISQVLRDHYEIQYLRSNGEGSLEHTPNTDCFFAYSESQSVLFLYEGLSVIFAGEETPGDSQNPPSVNDYNLHVTQLETGVYVSLPMDESLYTNNHLTNFAYNPNQIQGVWNFSPSSLITTALSDYAWTFTPTDNVNYKTASDTIKVDAVDVSTINISLERDGLYYFSAFQRFNPLTYKVLLNYSDTTTSDVTFASDIIYYHGSQKGTNDIISDVASWDLETVEAAINSTFLTGDTVFVVRYIPWDNTYGEFGPPYFAVFRLDGPVSKIILDVTPNIPASVYIDTPFASFATQNILQHGILSWYLNSEPVLYPLQGYHQYTYSFAPNDNANYESSIGMVWIDAAPVMLEKIEVENSPSIIRTAGTTKPTLDDLFAAGLVVVVYYNDPSKNTTYNNKSSDFSAFSLDYTNPDASDFIASDEYLVLSFIEDGITKTHKIPVKITKKTIYTQLNENLPASDSIVNYDPSITYEISVISNPATPYFLYTKVTQNEYEITDSDSRLMRGLLNSRSYYVKTNLSATNNSIYNAGTYNLLIVFDANLDYYNQPDDILYNLTINELTIEASAFNLIFSEPTPQSPVSELWNNDYWFNGNLPSIVVDPTSSAKAVIESGFFSWLQDDIPVETLKFMGVTSGASIVYTWVWNKPNYTTTTGTVTLKIYTNDITSISAGYNGDPYIYHPLDTIHLVSDGIIVTATYRDGQTRALSESQIKATYNNANSSDPDEFRLYGDHTKVTLTLISDPAISCILDITMEKNNYFPSTFEEVKLTVKDGTSYSVSATINDSNLSAKYYVFAGSLTGAKPSDADVLTIDSNTSNISNLTPEYYGYYIPFTPINAAGTYKVLAHFIPSALTARNYNPPQDLVSKCFVLTEVIIATNGYNAYYNVEFQYASTQTDKISQNLSYALRAYYSNAQGGEVSVPGTFAFVKKYFDIASVWISYHGEYVEPTPVAYNVVFTPDNTEQFAKAYYSLEINVLNIDDEDPFNIVTCFNYNLFPDELSSITRYAGDSVLDFLKTVLNNPYFTPDPDPDQTIFTLVTPTYFIVNYPIGPDYPTYGIDLNVWPAGSLLDFRNVLNDTSNFKLLTQTFYIPDPSDENQINTIHFEYMYNGFKLTGFFDISYVQVKNLADYITVSDSQSKDYDGNSFELNIVGSIEGDIITYKTEASEYQSDLSSLFSDMSAVGIYTFVINIERNNYIKLNKTITFEVYSNITFDMSSATGATFVNDSSTYTTKAPAKGSSGYDNLTTSIHLPDYYEPLGWYYVKDGKEVLLFKFNGGTLTPWVDMPSTIVYLKWRYVQYTITFDIGISADFTGTKPSSTKPYNSYLLLTDESGSWECPEIQGLHIVGWLSSLGEHYTLDAITNSYNLLVTKNDTLRAIWASVVFKIEFVLDENTSTFVKIGYGELADFYPLTLEQLLQATGLTSESISQLKSSILTGWTAESGYFTSSNFSFSTKISTTPLGVVQDSVIKFFPVWDTKIFEITLNSNYPSSNSKTVINHTYGDGSSALTKEVEFSRTGYLFVGWSDTSAGTIVFKTGDSPDYAGNLVSVDPENPSLFKLNLYAIWKPITYYIRYFSDSSQKAIDDERSFNYDTFYNLKALLFNKSGYSFLGWTLDSEKTSADYYDNDTVSNLTNINDSVVNIYALWSPIKYSIQFNANGGVDSQGLMEDKIYLKFDETIALIKNSYTRRGYYFYGWTINQESDELLYADSALVKNLTTLDESTVTLYAIWKLTKFVITWNPPVGAVGYMESATLTIEESWPKNGYLKNGYTFVSYSIAPEEIPSFAEESDLLQTMISANLADTNNEFVYLEVIIEFAPIRYSVKYVEIENTTKEQFVDYDEHATLLEVDNSRVGYSFKYWSLSPESTGEPLSEIYNLTDKVQTIYIYALWTPYKYTVSFNSDGGNNIDPITFTYDEYSNLPEATKENFIFTGWVDADLNHYSAGYYKNLVSNPSSDNTSSISLSAQWITKGNPGVQYISNGGSGQMQNTTGSAATMVTLTANSFTRYGYNFKGWGLSSASSSVSYQDGTQILLEDNLITLFAIWEALTFTLSIDKNGGTTEFDDPSQLVFASAYQINAPKKTGYVFVGYYLNNSEIRFALSGTFLNADLQTVTLSARYQPIEYSIVFNPNGGKGSIAPQEFYYDEIKNITKTTSLITKTGSYFAFWSYGEYNTILDGASVSNLTTIDREVITLTANWFLNPYSVEFHSNYGDDSTTYQNLTYSIPANLDINPFERTGYSFSRWTLNSDGSGAWYDDEYSVVSLTYEFYGTIHLYANWTPNTYFVDYDSNGGSGTMSRDKFTYDETKALTKSVFLKEGHAFIGWSLTQNGNVFYQNSESVLNLSSTNEAVITLYALYKAGAYIVHYDKNDQNATGSMLNSIHEYGTINPLNKPAFEKTGYSIIGWSLLPGISNKVDYVIDYSKSQLTSKEEITLYAVWRINNYTLTFNTNGGSFVPQITANYGDPIFLPDEEELPLKPGFEFNGWFADTELTIPFDQLTMPAENLTIFAGWTNSNIYYELSFDSAGGSHIDARYGTYGTPITDVSTPTREGYTFIGWYLNETDTSEYIITTMPAKDIKLTARWKPAIFEISFVTYGGGTVPTIIEHFGSILELPSLSKPGYTFEGWYTDTGLTDKFENSTMPANLDTLFAKWSKNKITISFNTYGGTSISPIIITVGDLIPNETPKRDGYLFAGWYLNKELSIPLTDEFQPTSDTMLYASWVEFNEQSAQTPAWLIILIILIILVIIATIVFIILSRKKREDLWKN